MQFLAKELIRFLKESHSDNGCSIKNSIKVNRLQEHVSTIREMVVFRLSLKMTLCMMKLLYKNAKPQILIFRLTKYLK